jgi:site-specific recombinase XerC
MKPPLPNLLARALRDFFAQHLPQLRGVSPHTVASYRDSIVLLLRFIASYRSRSMACLDLEDLDTAGTIAFLDHLEQERGNTASTRNVRLAAIHSFARYLASEHPERLEHAQRILSIPFKLRGPLHPRQIPSASQSKCSDARFQEGPSPHHPPQHRRAPSQSRRRSGYDQPLAGAQQPEHDEQVRDR